LQFLIKKYKFLRSCTFFPIFGHQYHTLRYLPTYLPSGTYLPTFCTYIPTAVPAYLPVPTCAYLPTGTYLPTYLFEVYHRERICFHQLLANKKRRKITKPPNMGAPLVNQVSNMGAPLVNQVSNMGAPCQSNKQQGRALPKGALPLAIK
jgi:hypothetical protein